MLRALVSTASRVFNDWARTLLGRSVPATENGELAAPPQRPYERLRRVVLTDEVSRTLFEEYAAHRATARGDEEIGWVLLGHRDPSEAIVLATLPAGAGRDAGVAHVMFNSEAQALASRIARQADRRLTMLGVLHTHPGSLRHPSSGDYRGDSLWVGKLRGREGVFGIGTADAEPAPGPPVATQPRPHVQCLGELCLSWYSLGEGDRNYRPLPAALTLGPDLARSLHSVWGVVETYAEPLDRLCRQLAGVTFQVTDGDGEPALRVELKLPEPGHALHLLLRDDGPRYYVLRGDQVLSVDPDEERIDRGLFLLLAELAGRE